MAQEPEISGPEVSRPESVGVPSESGAAWQEAVTARESSFHGYVQALANGRFVLRKVMQILDEQARSHGLEPLSHQALLQVYGSDGGITVGHIADRLGIAPAFGSRLVRQLEKSGFVERSPHPSDKRASIIRASQAGVDLLRDADRDIYRTIRSFQEALSEDERLSALLVFSAYVGVDRESVVAERLRENVRWSSAFR